MPAAWRDADEALLMVRSNGFQETGFTRLPRKRLRPLSHRLSSSPIGYLALPNSSLLDLISIPDAFNLDSAFDSLAPPRSRVYRWTVSAVAVPNTNRTHLVVNRRSPGPIIEANVHDRILVYLTNGLDKVGTSIHWHGLPQPQTPFYDGPAGISQCPVPPGVTLLYNFTFGGWTGTTWWHGHTGMQHTDGLFGPIVVHSPHERASEYASDHVLTMSDEYDIPSDDILETYLTSTSIEPVPEPVPDRAEIDRLGSGPHDDAAHKKPRTIVGRSNGDTKYFEVRARAGTTAVNAAFAFAFLSVIGIHYSVHPELERTLAVGFRFDVAMSISPRLFPMYRLSPDPHIASTRLRLIHAGTFAPLRVSVDGHALTLIEADGTPLEPRRVGEVVLQAAQRYSVLVTRDARDEREAFWIRTRLVEDEFGYNTPHPRPEASAVLRYTTSRPILHSRPLPTTRPGPPNRDVAKWWYALPQFDEWTLRPADAVFPSRQSTSEGNPNTVSDEHPKNDPGPHGNSDTHEDDGLTPQNNDTSSLRQDIGLPTARKNTPPPATTLPFLFSIQRTEKQNWRSVINKTIWEEASVQHAALVEDTAGIFSRGKSGVRVWPGNQLIATFAHGQTIDFVITNLDDGANLDFTHSSLSPCAITLDVIVREQLLLLGVGSGQYKAAEVKLNTKNPMRRDTFTVPKLGWAVVRIVADNAGYWAWHMVAGGLFQIAVMPAQGTRMTLPDDVVQQCKMWTA
ncbi:multicopper oxidase-domain-containing protein [Mycena capillaripes]|nr:multicopper oxidase-domain-containing protein [Mycena capillaripes]